jgi:hypothetical protein
VISSDRKRLPAVTVAYCDVHLDVLFYVSLYFRLRLLTYFLQLYFEIVRKKNLSMKREKNRVDGNGKNNLVDEAEKLINYS